MRIWFGFGFLLVFALYSKSMRAQDPRSSTTTLHVVSRLAVLDVRVVDAEGKFVPGLDQTQFSVFEDGKLQPILSFDPPVDHRLPGVAGKPMVTSSNDLDKIGSAVVNVIVIDELNTAFSDTARAQDAIRKYLKAQPEILPAPTLFVASGASRVAVLHDFTQKRADLLDSMSRHITDVDFRALTNQLNGGSVSAPDGFAKTLGALSQLASSLRGIPGHKNVIWVGSGFGNAYDLTSASDQDAPEIQAALQLVTQRMLDARISLSTIDPNGVDALASQENIEAEAIAGNGANSLTDFTQDISFDELARSTGGTIVKGRNDLDRMVAEAAHAQDEYYTLTYRPAAVIDPAKPYRKIRVVMKDPNMHAITRTGYFSGGVTEPAVDPAKPKSQSREFRYDLLSAGGSHLVYSALNVSAHPDTNGYVVSVEARDLTWTPQPDGTRTAEVSIVGAAFDAKDKSLAQVAKELKERIHPTDDTLHAQITFKVAFITPPTTKRIRFVVRDAVAGAIGSVDLGQ